MADIKYVISPPAVRGLSLSDRMSRTIARRRRYRQPLVRALLVTPEDPVAGDKQAGEAIFSGHFLIHGQHYPFITVESTTSAGHSADALAFIIAASQLSPDIADYLHSFRWLRDLAATEIALIDSTAIAEAIISAWLDEYGATPGTIPDFNSTANPSAAAWRSDICSWQILMLASHARLAIPVGEEKYHRAIWLHITQLVAYLEKAIDSEAPGKTQIVAWIGIVATALLFSQGNKRRIASESGLKQSLHAGFYSDGGIVSRAPGDQLEAVQALAMLGAIYAARASAPPEFMTMAQRRAVAALLGISHGDGGLSSWQGHSAIDAQQVRTTVNASGMSRHALVRPKEWGYQRMIADDVQLIADAAPPPIGRQIAAGCASTLAFELSKGQRRIIVNCGGAALYKNRHAHDLAHGLRTTAAHSTVTLAHNNSSKLLPDGALLSGVTRVTVARVEQRHQKNHEQRLEMHHDGYINSYGMIHRRTLILTSMPHVALRGKDKLYPGPKHIKKRIFASTEACARFHLGVDVTVETTASKHCVILRVDGGWDWEFRVVGHSIVVEDSLWVDHNGQIHPTVQIVIHAIVPPEGVDIGWVLRQITQ